METQTLKLKRYPLSSNLLNTFLNDFLHKLRKKLSYNHNIISLRN